MRITNRTLRLAAWMLTSGAVALAQVGGDDAALDELRKRTPAGDNDNAIIDKWLADRFAVESFRTDLTAVREDASTTPAFQTALADRLNTFAKNRLADPNNAVDAVTRLVQALIDIDDVKTRESLLAALGHPHQAVRYLGAKGLHAVRDRIAAGTNPNELRDLLAALRTAAAAETNNTVLDRICRAMSVPNNDDARTALIDVLLSQNERYRRGAILADRTEIAVFEYLATANLDAAELTRAVQAAAVLLRLDVARYIAGQNGRFVADEQAVLQQRIATVEGWLEQVVRPPADRSGNLRQAIAGEQATLAETVQFELNKWIGTADSPGVLNAAPWNVPVAAP
ncbi:MAG: hypothetical protein HOP29_18950 [Phycisphaerales bacterium]|nr:hypothetical protein [Phycisphaerales bacterium]